jgi:hypothetical protein
MPEGRIERGEAECDRCGDLIGPLEPCTNIQFSGGVDALRTACHNCIEEIVEVWNEGEMAGGQDE